VLQYNYILVVGAEERQNQTVNVRLREGQIKGAMALNDLLQEFQHNCDNFM
jgi:threonyl-tRNA synthetase